MHCQIAECSLSIGYKDTLYSLSNSLIISPAITNVSLLARAISLCALIAQTVGFNPALPTSAFINSSSFPLLTFAIYSRPLSPNTFSKL